MTFGITDYPSLGFREDRVGVGSASMATNSWAEPFGCVSRLLKQLSGKEETIKVKEEKIEVKKEKKAEAEQDEDTGKWLQGGGRANRDDKEGDVGEEWLHVVSHLHGNTVCEW